MAICCVSSVPLEIWMSTCPSFRNSIQMNHHNLYGMLKLGMSITYQLQNGTPFCTLRPIPTDSESKSNNLPSFPSKKYNKLAIFRLRLQVSKKQGQNGQTKRAIAALLAVRAFGVNSFICRGTDFVNWIKFSRKEKM